MSLPTRTEPGFAYVRRYPTDLAVVSAGAVLAYLAVTSLPAGNGLRTIASVPLVAFFPGYALVSVLFPTRARPANLEAVTDVKRHPRGIDTVERLGLSFVLSLLVATGVVLGLAPTDWGLTVETTAAAFGVTAVAFAQLGVLRRIRVPEPDRYDVSARTVMARLRPARRREGGIVATASTLLLAAGIVATALALTVALVSPQPTGGFTELGLYTEDEDGDLVADGYPDVLDPGESASLVVAVENEEGTETSYTVVVQQQRLEGETVTDRTELDRLEVAAADGETATVDHDLTPAATNETVRVVYLLYQDDVPTDPTRADAHEDVYAWVTVTDGEDDAPADDEGA